MAISSKALVELILLGPVGDRRQLQDSPILGDVWLAYALDPRKRHDLLITPDWHHPPGKVAASLARLLRDRSVDAAQTESHEIAYLDGLVAARLPFRDVIGIVVPMTAWWRRTRLKERLDQAAAAAPFRKILGVVLEWVRAQDNPDALHEAVRAFGGFSAEDRYTALAAIILWASEAKTSKPGLQSLERLKGPEAIVKHAQALFAGMPAATDEAKESVYQVSLNRKAHPALSKSVAAGKGDAVRNVFKVNCAEIGWAVLDSGIDADHKAFLGEDGKTRVAAAYDFSNIRQLISLENRDADNDTLKARHPVLFSRTRPGLSAAQIGKILRELAEDADNDRPIHWENVEN